MSTDLFLGLVTLIGTVATIIIGSLQYLQRRHHKRYAAKHGLECTVDLGNGKYAHGKIIGWDPMPFVHPSIPLEDVRVWLKNKWWDNHEIWTSHERVYTRPINRYRFTPPVMTSELDAAGLPKYTSYVSFFERRKD